MIYGPAYKGIPLASTTAISFYEKFSNNVPFCFNRKEIKDHGEGGDTFGSKIKNRVIIIDDVISAGTSIKESLDIIDNNGGITVGAIVAVDRQERGQGEKSAIEEAKTKFRIKIISIINLDNIISYISVNDNLREHVQAINIYREEYGTLGVWLNNDSHIIIVTGISDKNLMYKKLSKFIILIPLIGIALNSGVSARMKCWTNDEGIKECGDKVPPEYTQQGYQEISKGGIVREEKERVKTKKELEEAKKEAASIARKKQEQEIKKAHDKMLLKTFTDVAEIEETRDQKINSVQSTIRITEKRIIKLEKQLEDEDNKDSVNEKITENQIFIQKKIDEQETIRKTYSKYIKRFKELKGLK